MTTKVSNSDANECDIAAGASGNLPLPRFPRLGISATPTSTSPPFAVGRPVRVARTWGGFDAPDPSCCACRIQLGVLEYGAGAGGRQPTSILPAGPTISGLEHLHLRHLRTMPGDRIGPESVLYRQSLLRRRE